MVSVQQATKNSQGIQSKISRISKNHFSKLNKSKKFKKLIQSNTNLRKTTRYHFLRELFTKGSGLAHSNMVTVYRYGQMGPNIKASGFKVKRVAKANSLMPMEMFMKDSGKKTKLMDLVYILIAMEHNMRDTGSMICNREMENKHGLMVVSTKVCTKMVKSMDLENTNGQMEVFTRVVG